MGLFGSIMSGLGKAAVSAAHSVAETGREMNQLKMEYMSYSDSRLVSLWRNTSSLMVKTVAYAELKSRHGEETAKEMIRRG